MRRYALMIQGVVDGDYWVSSVFIYRDPSGVVSITRYQYLGPAEKIDMSLGFYLGDIS